MNFLQRMLHKQSRPEGRSHVSQKVMVCYEATISFEASFLVHFYDAANKPFLLERTGKYFYYQDYLPSERSAAYFRVHVFNPLRLLGQTVTISIKVRNEIAVLQTFAISNQHSFADWHSVKADLV
ncbi:MAG: hypothetical protein ABI741_08255 [Ferruginibacter sp.]